MDTKAQAQDTPVALLRERGATLRAEGIRALSVPLFDGLRAAAEAERAEGCIARTALEALMAAVTQAGEEVFYGIPTEVRLQAHIAITNACGPECDSSCPCYIAGTEADRRPS